jgi:hypothetical protein
MANRGSLARLIRGPALVTMAVTILRLTGELEHWSKTWFNPQMSGSIVGITWLAPVFGIYFAIKLVRADDGPKRAGRAVGFALLAVLVACGLSFVGARLHLPRSFQGRLIWIWFVSALAALATLPGWSALFKTLLAYAYAARVPVAIIMFFAFRGSWGTHYDAAPSGLPPGMSLVSKYLWLGFFPQLIFWVGYTIVVGTLFGSLAGAIAQRLRRPAEATSGRA